MAEANTDKQTSEKKGFFSRIFGGWSASREEKKAEKAAVELAVKTTVAEERIRARAEKGIMRETEKEEKGGILGYVFDGMLKGLIWGTLLGVISTFLTKIPFFGFSLIPLIVAGVALGGIYGLIKGTPIFAPAVNILKSIAILTVLGTFVLYGITLHAKGFFDPTLTEAGKIGNTAKYWFQEQIGCLGNLKECYAGGWETTTEEQQVYVNVNFLTKDIFYEGKNARVDVQIEVLNPDIPATTEFMLYPECYVDDKATDVEYGQLIFTKSKKEQGGSFACVVKSDDMKNKENIKLKVKLFRPVYSRAGFSVVTLSEEKKGELRKMGETVPGEENPRGSSVRYIGIPYEFGIGIGQSQPLSEGEYSLWIKINKKPGEGKIHSIGSLTIGRGGKTAKIEKCDDFSNEGEYFKLKELSEDRIKKIAETGEVFSCTMRVEAGDEEDTVNFVSDFNYFMETEYEQGIIIVKGKA